MVKLIVGLNGSGKTRQLVDLVREAVEMGNGDVVVIENERKLTYDIPYQARLIDASVYDVGSYEFLKGVLCGIHSGNYDITHIFIDNFYKLIKDKSPETFSAFIDWLDKFSKNESIEFVVCVSAEAKDMPEDVQGYII